MKRQHPAEKMLKRTNVCLPTKDVSVNILVMSSRIFFFTYTSPVRKLSRLETQIPERNSLQTLLGGTLYHVLGADD